MKKYFVYLMMAFAVTALASCTGDGYGSDGADGQPENPENPNCNLQIKFVYPAKYTDPGILVKIQKQFVEDYFGENYSALQPKEAVDAYTNDYIVAYKDLEPEFKENLEKTNGESVGAWYSYYEMSSDVIRYNKRNLVSYTVKFENYTGGAHGSEPLRCPDGWRRGSP